MHHQFSLTDEKNNSFSNNLFANNVDFDLPARQPPALQLTAEEAQPIQRVGRPNAPLNQVAGTCGLYAIINNIAYVFNLNANETDQVRNLMLQAAGQTNQDVTAEGELTSFAAAQQIVAQYNQLAPAQWQIDIHQHAVNAQTNSDAQWQADLGLANQGAGQQNQQAAPRAGAMLAIDDDLMDRTQVTMRINQQGQHRISFPNDTCVWVQHHPQNGWQILGAQQWVRNQNAQNGQPPGQWQRMNHAPHFALAGTVVTQLGTNLRFDFANNVITLPANWQFNPPSNQGSSAHWVMITDVSGGYVSLLDPNRSGMTIRVPSGIAEQLSTSLPQNLNRGNYLNAVYPPPRGATDTRTGQERFVDGLRGGRNADWQTMFPNQQGQALRDHVANRLTHTDPNGPVAMHGLAIRVVPRGQ